MSLEAKLETFHKNDTVKMERIKAHEGWIVLINKNSSITSCFVPDRSYKWLSSNAAPLLDNSNIMDRLFIRLSDLLPPRISNALKEENLYFVGDIVCSNTMIKDMSFNRLKYLNNLGQKSYKEISDALSVLGFNDPIKSEEFWSERLKREENKQ